MIEIGTLRSSRTHTYEAPRQPAADFRGELAQVEILPEYRLGLEGIEGFDRLWLLFRFHHAHSWRLKVHPPRAEKKYGVFATRSPHRPNSIGLSCVSLLEVNKQGLLIRGHDLLDGTPILDIKPYLHFCDSFPEARAGWTEGLEQGEFEVAFETQCQKQLLWLESQGVPHLREVLSRQLASHPEDRSRKRVEITGDQGIFAYRTFRAHFTIHRLDRRISVRRIDTGYSAADLEDPSDPYGDKELHRQLLRFYK